MPGSHQEKLVKRAHRKETFGKERQTRRRREVACFSRWFWTLFTAGLFYLALSRVGEADNPGIVCATAKLYDAHFDESGQWAANLTNKSEEELSPLFAPVGACRRMFGERFEKESYPYSSSVSQDIHDTLKRARRSSLLVSLEPAVRLPHAQLNRDYLSRFHDGGQKQWFCGWPAAGEFP